MVCRYVRRGLPLVAASLVLAPPLAVAITTPATIKITDVAKEYRHLDQGPPGSGVGDVEIIDAALYNASITKRAIGRGQLMCTFLDRRSRDCSGTFFLPRGKLVVAGVVSTRLFYEVAVIGGTGLYANARGTLTVTSLGLRPRRELLLFRLVP